MTRQSLVWKLLLGAAMVSDAVAQTIAVSPDTLRFFGRVGGPNPSPQTASITGTGAPSWRIVGPTASWLSVSPQRGSAPATLSVAVNLAGLRAGVYEDTVDLAANNRADPTATVVVILLLGGEVVPGPTPSPTPPRTPPLPPGGQWAEYQVELLYIGYTGLVDGYPNCAVNTRGTDRMTGNLIGIETQDPDEEAEYNGTLIRVTAIDICDSKGRNRPADVNDEQVWCSATLTGSARMQVNFKVHAENAEPGAYFRSKPAPGAATSTVSGDCAVPTMAQYQTDYPGGGSGGSPDGQTIEDAFGTVKFVVGHLARLRVGTYPPDPSQGLVGSPGSGWTLRVIRKIR